MSALDGLRFDPTNEGITLPGGDEYAACPCRSFDPDPAPDMCECGHVADEHLPSGVCQAGVWV